MRQRLNLDEKKKLNEAEYIIKKKNDFLMNRRKLQNVLQKKIKLSIFLRMQKHLLHVGRLMKREQ
jgi:hypothetical protein